MTGSPGRLFSLVVKPQNNEALDPHARRKRELSGLTKDQLQALIADLETANDEKQKINQKYAKQVKEMTVSATAANRMNNVYENNNEAEDSMNVGGAAGKGLKNYESMP